MEKRECTYKIKDLPLEDRPQEKLLKYGADNLSNAELLALIIRTGTKTKTSVELSQEIINSLKREGVESEVGISALSNTTIKDLLEIKGIGISKASMIMAAVTLSKRINKESIHSKKKIKSPNEVVKYVMSEMRFLKNETFKIVILNTKKEIESIRDISSGIINATIVHPREVFFTAVNESAHTIILLHNHPSGDPKPSKEDIELTDRMIKAGEIMQIPVIDHIVIGDNVYYSFLENGLI
ncbi:DNA replication and repair protein RadC [Anaerosphaera aminiphila DSM 21120]|uniref:DNA replication and repair protein RadC n=1 Tax=Anaerosphaera aminiphila DSM 21120 TaxID=1120995 RepID=A0A1M5PA88_9FIRM|nr:DNA repair protein RadC [Anaerosphaera aminiphila]SHG98688.1 DNA replication and repair protein RadC [Anaerosphaera aminiphila DSM 21120]